MTPRFAHARWFPSAAVVMVLALAGCTAAPASDIDPGPAATVEPSEATPPSPTSFAIISDYGGCDDGAAEAARMVQSWNPSIIVTAGDNTQGVTGCTPFTESVGDLYASYLDSPDGPRFFPVPGNHDYEDENAGEAAYLEYFSYLRGLTDTPLWYRVGTGSVNLFMLNSETPADQLEVQREWLQESLTAAAAEDPARWNIVVFHRPPFTSGPHEPNLEMRPEAGWEYRSWGADVVVTGHQHVLETLEVDDLTYVVAGVGATGLVRPCPPELVPESDGCTEGFGALMVTATDSLLTLEYRTPDGGSGRVLDVVEVSRSE